MALATGSISVCLAWLEANSHTPSI
jgi:hypothetical protein